MKVGTSSLLAFLALVAVRLDVMTEVKREMPAGVKEILANAKQLAI